MGFTVEELLPECDRCKGTGELESHESNQSKGGFGKQVLHKSPEPCDACNGKGAIPSATGKVLIDFINRAQARGLLR